MRKGFSLLGKNMLGVVALLVGMICMSYQSAEAQTHVELPRLKLVADQPTVLGNNTFYPDGRIWIPRSPSGAQREVLVPVLIHNCWISDPEINEIVEPIKSFDFKIQYDSRALQAVGVQFQGPRAEDTYALAKGFKIAWNDVEDNTYKTSISGSQVGDPNGRRIRISGTTVDSLNPSPAPFPNARCNQREYVELLYVRFIVKATPGSLGDNTPLIITNDTLRWNDRTPTEAQWPGQGQPTQFAGLFGYDNTSIDPEGITEPTRFGMAYVRIHEVPELGFAPATVIEPIEGSGQSEWVIKDAMVIDSANRDLRPNEVPPAENVVRRRIDVLDIVEETRITDIRITSDQPWLKFRTVGAKALRPSNSANGVREGFLDFIDNGIMGRRNPIGNPTEADPTTVMEIICDAQEAHLMGLPAGVYTGYITLSSPSLAISPVRIRVTFVIYRNAMEPNTHPDVAEQDEVGRGIRLNVENSASVPQKTSMLFGVGTRATNDVDELFGERAYEFPLAAGSFGARWYPLDDEGQVIVENGMGDITGRSFSRDIRDAHEDRTHIYYCRFDAGGPENYPVILSWTTDDFPEGAQLFLRDVNNGQDFSTNMRGATPVPGTNNVFTYTIEDARFNEFIIEYTPPATVRIPELNEGWNLVSLPVRPGDADYRKVYVNAQDAPKFFNAGDYQDEPEGILKFGRGYFVKYGPILDEFIGGIVVDEIGEGTPYKVLVNEGWNTVGAVSHSAPIENISFDAYVDANRLPEMASNVYRYVTDRGYEAVASMEPGFGYWIKVQNAETPGETSVGYFHLVAANAKSTGLSQVERQNMMLGFGNAITVVDANGRQGQVHNVDAGLFASTDMFELPPVPFTDLFDVRFSSNTSVATGENNVVMINGATYPVSVNVSQGVYNVVNAISGEMLGTVTAANPVVVENSNVKAIRLEKRAAVETGLSISNMPNPVVNETVVSFTVAEESDVTVTLFNSLGEEVATIVSDNFAAGQHSVSFDAKSLAAGTYVARIVAGQQTMTTNMVVVK